jgi:hypothetical protein
MFFSGVASGPDKNVNNTDRLNPFYTGSVTPTNNNEVVLSCFTGSGFSSVTASSPIIQLDTASTGSYATTVAGYDIQTTATTINPEWTQVISAIGNAGVTASFYSQETPAPLVITNTGVPEGFVSVAYGPSASIYSNRLSATGGVLPYTWSCPSPCALPSTLSISSTGMITGTPIAALAATNVTFRVTDANSTVTSVTLPITISTSAPSVTAGTCTGALLNMTQYQSYAGCALSASGGVGGWTFSQSSVSNSYGTPEGLTLNSSTGAFTSSYVTAQGTYTSIFNAMDALGTYDSVTVVFQAAGYNVNQCLPWTGSIFNRDLSILPVDTSPAAPINSAYLSATIKALPSIPWLTVPYTQPDITTYVNGLNYFPPQTSGTSMTPIPLDAPQEGPAATNGDHHVLVFQQAIDGGKDCSLWEGYASGANVGGTAIGYWTFSGTDYLPDMATYGMINWQGSTQDNGGINSAGIPLAPELLNYDEVAAGGQTHPVPFTLNHGLNRYVWPATSHGGGLGTCTGGHSDVNGLIVQGTAGGGPPTSCTGGPAFGEIFRLKSSVSNPCSSSTNPLSYAIIQGFYKYGIEFTDNGLSGYIELTTDSRWDTTSAQTDLSCLNNLILANFEPVNVSSIITTLDSNSLPTVSYQANQPVLTTITAAPSTASLETGVGATQQFTSTCYYNDTSTDNCTVAGGVTWSSSNTGVATITSGGLAMALSTSGTSTITATNGSIHGTAALTTYNVPTSYYRGLIVGGDTGLK